MGTDVVLAATWAALAADNLLLARRSPWPPRPPCFLRLGFAAGLLAVALGLEGLTGRLLYHPAAAAAGLLLAAGGLSLHATARRTLGSSWTESIVADPASGFVEHGPYAVVRHPLYLGLLLMAAGTVLAHPSPATVCAAAGLTIGIARKLRSEERALRAAFGARHAAYAARVPALLPLGRHR